MTREEKCEYAISIGYTYDYITGKTYGIKKQEIKSKHFNGYIQLPIRKDNKKIHLYGHHFAWYCIYGNCDTDEIDHINGIKDDNRICNLRSVTHQENMWNISNAKGYYYYKSRKKYRALIYKNSKCIHLGMYNSEQEARQAYLNAKEKYHII